MESGTQKPNEWYTVELDITKNTVVYQVKDILRKFINKKVRMTFQKPELGYVETPICLLKDVNYNECDNTDDIVLQSPSGEIVVKVSDVNVLLIGEVIVEMPLPVKLTMHVKKDTHGEVKK